MLDLLAFLGTIKMNWKIFSLISILTLSIPATFAEQATDTQSQQKLDSSGEPLTVTHLPLTLINTPQLLTCHTNNLQKIMDNLKLPFTASNQNLQVLVEFKDDGKIKRIQTNGRNNDITVQAIKKAIFKSVPFDMPKDESKIHLCNKIEFVFYSETKRL